MAPRKKTIKKKRGRPAYTPEQRAAGLLASRAKRNQKEERERDHNKRLDEALKVAGKRNKEIRTADLRLRLMGGQAIDRINCIVDEFTLLDQGIKRAKDTKKNPNRVSKIIRRNTARGQILKAQADLLFRKLNKLLPDIKAIEHNGTFRPSKPDHMSEEDLIDILKGNVDTDELVQMFPQYKDLMETLEDLEIPELSH